MDGWMRLQRQVWVRAAVSYDFRAMGMGMGRHYGKIEERSEEDT